MTSLRLKHWIVSIALVVSLSLACAPPPPATPDAGADAGSVPIEDAGIDAGVDAGVPDAGPYVPDPLVVARPFAEVVPVGYARWTSIPRR